MNKPLILVVEDDPSIRNLITTTLKTNDYRYVVAPSGSTAIMEATSHNPEIILLDLGLPDMDGVQVIQTVRSWSNAPIIVISARSEDNDKIHALDAGADDYLTKPFSVEELLARLRVTQRRLSLMTAEMFTASSVFVNGKLKVDYAGGCAYLDENELHLTPMEYKLLCLLSKNVGKVLTHTFITQNIWGRSWDNDVASLRVFMATLRKKLEPNYAYMQPFDLEKYVSLVDKGVKPFVMLFERDEFAPVFAAIKGQFDSGVFEPQKLRSLSEIPFSELLFPLLERWRNNGLMEAADGVYKLTPMGLFWQNQLNRAVMIAVQYLVYGPRVAGRKSALTMMSAMENRT